MKKFIILLFTAVLAFSMTGCDKVVKAVEGKVVEQISEAVGDLEEEIPDLSEAISNLEEENSDSSETTETTEEENIVYEETTTTSTTLYQEVYFTTPENIEEEEETEATTEEEIDVVEIIEGFPINCTGQELIDLCYPILSLGAFSNCLKSQHFAYVGEEIDSDENSTVFTLDYWTYGGNAAFESEEDGKYVNTILRYTEFHQYLIMEKGATQGLKFPIMDEHQSGFFQRMENLKASNGLPRYNITNPISGELIEARLIDCPVDDVIGLTGEPGLYIERMGPAGLIHKTWYSLKLGMFYKAVIESEEGRVFDECELVVYDDELNYKAKVTPSNITWLSEADLIDSALGDLGMSLNFDALPDFDGMASNLTDYLGTLNEQMGDLSLEDLLNGEGGEGLDALGELLNGENGEGLEQLQELLNNLNGEDGEGLDALQQLLGGDKAKGLGQLQELLNGLNGGNDEDGSDSLDDLINGIDKESLQNGIKGLQDLFDGLGGGQD